MKIKPGDWLALTKKQQLRLLGLAVMMNKPGCLIVRKPACGASELNPKAEKIIWISFQSTKKGNWLQ
jgi:hypothetical protein